MAALLAFAFADGMAQTPKPVPAKAPAMSQLKKTPMARLAPAERIPVAPLGYIAPSSAYLHLRLSFNSLDFIDGNRLLFTFHKNGLMKRIPGDPQDDEDQIIHAVVLDVHTGKPLREADWRMHDMGRYLWALRDGTFLVRVRNDLFLTDQSLVLKPYLHFDTDVQAVQVSPSRNLLLIEVKKLVQPKPPKAGANAADSDNNAPQARTELLLLRPGEKKALAGAITLNPSYVPLLGDGLLEADEGRKPKQWLVVKDLLDKAEKQVGTVQSECPPQLVVLSDDVVLAQSCPGHAETGTDVSALSMMGGILWQDHWDSRYIWPHVVPAENGSRFAYESLAMNRDVAALDYFGEADVQSQPVGVIDTLTGKLALVLDASPILSAGQNFSLSADGRRFAVLRNGAIEVYDLPPIEAAATPAKTSR